MQYKLINKVNDCYSAVEQVLTNRGIPYDKIERYLNPSVMDLCHPENLDNIDEAAALFIQHIKKRSHMLVVQDVDADGLCSTSILVNWLYDFDESYAIDCVDIFIHDDKSHGLDDKCMKAIASYDYKIVIVPDAASNDYTQHKILSDAGIDVICLDHHEVEDGYSRYAIVVNNQLSKNYTNKAFCGGGVTYKFLKYIETYYTNTNYADDYLDMVALSLISDMMSQLSFETCYYIRKGLKQIKNPYFYYMWQKNRFKLGDNLDPLGVAFYITPFINAFCRSGTTEEKRLLLQATLKQYAFNQVPSTKRGHKMGEMETIVEQACRVSTNVKNRQQKSLDKSEEIIIPRIEEQHLLDNKVLLLLLEPGIVEKNIAGLLANRLMAKYQRPCCVLTQGGNKNNICWQGSARGCDIIDVRDFKQICKDTGETTFQRGHAGAFGLSIKQENIDKFIEKTNIILEKMPSTAVYYVDYIFNGQDVDPKTIIDIANMKPLWGKDVDESYIAVKGLKINKNNIILMSPDKSPTLKITLNNGVNIIKFNSSEEEYLKYAVDGYVEVDIVGKCNSNQWLGHITPQILVEQMEIKDRKDYYF